MSEKLGVENTEFRIVKSHLKARVKKEKLIFIPSLPPTGLNLMILNSTSKPVSLEKGCLLLVSSGSGVRGTLAGFLYWFVSVLYLCLILKKI